MNHLLKDRKISLIDSNATYERRQFYIRNLKRHMLNDLIDYYPVDQCKITFKVGTLDEKDLAVAMRDIYHAGLDQYIYDGHRVTRERAEELIKQSYIVVEMIVEVDDGQQ